MSAIRVDLRLNPDRLRRACCIWNRLTDPAAPRTDRKHAIYSKRAQLVYDTCLRYAVGTGHVRESEWSGRMFARP